VGDILQPTHLLFVLVIALLVLGPKRLPEVGRSLGRGLRDFRHAMNGGDDASAEAIPAANQAAAPAPPPASAPAPQPTDVQAATAGHPAEPDAIASGATSKPD
jgi:sec-independent protein translocase protein TatA